MTWPGAFDREEWMMDLRGIEYPMFAGLGAIVMLCTATPVLAIFAIWFPALWAWVFAPIAFGAVAGLIAATVIK